jgi:acetoacetyl-CoA synthetase
VVVSDTCSDGILNPSGVRFGSAEIYAVTETFPEIHDSICVGQRRKQDPDERVLLFIKMNPKHTFDSKFTTQLKSAIRLRYSPRHVPKHIFPVKDIPYTVNGKKCEINVKQVVSGHTTAVSGTVANPESLKYYQEYLYLPTDGRRQLSRLSRL